MEKKFEKKTYYYFIIFFGCTLSFISYHNMMFIKHDIQDYIIYTFSHFCSHIYILHIYSLIMPRGAITSYIAKFIKCLVNNKMLRINKRL